MKKLFLFYFAHIILVLNQVYCENYIGGSKGSNGLYRWSSTNIHYRVDASGATDNGLDYNATASLIQSAYNVWENVSTSNIAFTFDGSVTGSDCYDGVNGHYWVYPPDSRFSSIFYDDPNTQEIEGASVITVFEDNSNVLTDVDIVYNGKKEWKGTDYLTWWNEVESVAIHEIGHSLGLDHADGGMSPQPVMTYSALPSSNRRELKFDDMKGVSFLYGGNLIDNETFSGSKYFNWSITNASGKTLTFQSGSSINFADGASLTINGTLSAQGTSSSNISFNRSGSSGTWGGIHFNSGSSGNISYSTITNAFYGIYAYETSSLSISNTEIYNCSGHGIYIYRTNYTNQPTISNCTIHNNSSSTGIVMYWSSPDITGCNVYSNYNGLGIADYSSPRLGYTNVYGNNNIHNNSNVGVYSKRYSSPLLGINSSPYQGGNNIIATNTFRDAQAETYCTVNSENNWWGSNPPDANKIAALSGSTIDYDPYLTSQPNLSWIYDDAIANQKGILNKAIISGNNVSHYSQISLSYSSVGADDFDAAFEIYQLNKKWNQVSGNDLKSFKSYLKELADKKDKKMLYAAAKLILAGYEKESRIQMIDEVITDYDGSPIIQTALMSKFLYYFNETKDYQSADKIMQEIELKFPGSSLVEETKKHFALLNSSQQQNSNYPASLNQVNVSTKVDGYLIENYPNPFNPTTKISFSIPQKSQIKLKVFDVLGREILTLSDGFYEAGKYEVTFDASKLSSGIYFYNLTTSNGSFTKKMLLIK